LTNPETRNTRSSTDSFCICFIFCSNDRHLTARQINDSLVSTSELLAVAGFTRPIPIQNSGSEPNPFYFWIGTYTVEPGKRAEVVSILSDFSSVIEQTEPETLSYIVYLSTNEGNEDTIYLWEQYSSEIGFRDVHMTSDAASKLKDQIGPFLTGRSMAGYRQVYFECS
jgi:quinol monooxygenase YgiN